MNNYVYWGIVEKGIYSISDTSFVFINAFGELMGMFVFVFILVSVLCNFNLTKSNYYLSKPVGWIVIGISIGLMTALLISYGIQFSLLSNIDTMASEIQIKQLISTSLNPALVIASIFKGVNNSIGYIPVLNGLIYIIFEFIGGLLGALLSYILFVKHINNEPDILRIESCFYTKPSIKNFKLNFLSEMIATFILSIFIYSTATLFAINNIFIKIILISVVVGGIGYGLGGLTGYSMNPFRDSCPKIIYWIFLSKNDSNFKNDANHSIITIVSPIIGSLFAMVIMPGFLY